MKFHTGEEVICINAKDSDGLLREGKTYIVLGPGLFCNCCIDVGVRKFAFEDRFRRPIIEMNKIVNVDKVDV